MPQEKHAVLSAVLLSAVLMALINYGSGTGFFKYIFEDLLQETTILKRRPHNIKPVYCLGKNLLQNARYFVMRH